MSKCAICGESLQERARICSVCGTSVAEGPVPVAAVVAAPVLEKPWTRLHLTDAPPAGKRFCLSCGTHYDPDYPDSFCRCGVELMSSEQLAGLMDKEGGGAKESAGPPRPPAGTRCLLLYGSDKKPVRYFPLEKDATLIGRLDAVEGVFPEIDLFAWLDEATARKASRRHVLILRSRANNTVHLRPLAGNTGTQIDADMVPALHDYPLEPGRRIILGGAVRFKFEIT
ncbi:MAG: FHA domain-containing protein [Planctomycetes bacterium]|nr:FHA domain-containing protein [Planctomycetota bacterium]